jgi:hypothetical protein
MLSFKVNLSVYVLAFWLVVLQVMSPFVHAHTDADMVANQVDGLHVHMVNFVTADNNVNHGQHTIVSNDDAFDTHIVEMGKGLIQKLEPLLAIAAIFSFLIFPILLLTSVRLKPQQQIQPKPTYLRGYHSPRSPPYC